MVDELCVSGIECWGHHGVFEHEKREGQPFVIDLVLGHEGLALALLVLEDAVVASPS